MSEKITAKPIPECRFDLIYITDVNKDGVEDLVMLETSPFLHGHRQRD